MDSFSLACKMGLTTSHFECSICEDDEHGERARPDIKKPSKLKLDQKLGEIF